VSRVAAIVLTLLAAVLAACGTDDAGTESAIIGDTLTVYASVPRTGPLAPVGEEVLRGQKLALREAGGRAGPFEVNLVALDAVDPETGRWSPGVIAANARKAVQDRQTIAYLGEIETGASSISVPVLNSGGILQVSPRDTFGGLTAPGGNGEPDKYYPSGERTFARVVPGDDAQARALVALMRARGVRRVLLADDRELAGSSLGDRVARLLDRAGVEVVERARLDPRDEVPDSLARAVRAAGADAFFYGGGTREFALEVLRRVHRAAPRLALFSTDDLALAPELPARVGDAAGRLLLTGILPGGGAERAAFRRAYEQTYGTPPGRQAIYGYRAMRLALEAIRRAGPEATSRRAVAREAMGLAGADGAVGASRFAPLRIEGRRLVAVDRRSGVPGPP